jgi:hypothetical protein
MKNTSLAKDFNYSVFAQQAIKPEEYSSVRNGAVTIKASDLDNENIKDLVKQMEKDTAKGLAKYFNEGEEIYFPPFEKMYFEFDGFEIYNGDLRINLKVSAKSERYKEFMFPLSITRRVPLAEEVTLKDKSGKETVLPDGRAFLLEGNPLGSILLEQMSDLKRCRLLAGKQIRVIGKCVLTQAKFEIVDGKPKATDERKRLTCYKFEEC